MNEPRQPFDGLRPSGAPGALRGRVLDAARAALATRPAQPDRWTRIVRSRPLRLAWAASVAALAIAHLSLGEREGAPQRRAIVRPSLGAQAEADLDEIVSLAAIDLAAPRGLGSARPNAKKKEEGS